MNNSVFRQVRYSLYFAFVLNGIIIQWIAPFQYKCNFTGEKCFACGLRTAVDLFLHGRFSEAYQSNKLIVILVVAAVIMAIDVGLYFHRSWKMVQCKTT